MSCSVAYAHAGMYDRWLGNFVSLCAIMLTTCLTQIACFILIRENKCRHYRMRLLLVAKNLQKKWWINMIVTWGLSSFMLSSYLTVAAEGLFILGFLLLFIVWVYYSYLVLAGNRRWLFVIKPLYFYTVASLGQVGGFILYAILCIMEWFRYLLRFADNDCGIISYIYPNVGGIDYMVYDMLHVIIAMVIPYIPLMIYYIFARLAEQ